MGRRGKGNRRTYSTSGSLEAVVPRLSLGPTLSRHDGLEGLGDQVPELVVLVTEKDDDAVGLAVEGRGDVLDGLVDDLLNLVLADGEVLAEGVVGAALLDELDEAVGGHFGGLLLVLKSDDWLFLLLSLEEGGR